MVLAQGFLDNFSVDNITSGLMQLWSSIELWAREIGPGTLLLGALGLGAVYYFIVRPR